MTKTAEISAVLSFKSYVNYKKFFANFCKCIKIANIHYKMNKNNYMNKIYKYSNKIFIKNF